MSAHIWFSPVAVADVEEIGYYVACENYAAALDLADRLFDAFSSLAENPKMGRPRPEFHNARSLAVRPYVVLYREVKDGIEIIRVLHGARDIDSAMRPQGDE